MARPKKNPEDRRDQQLKQWATKKQKAAIQARADKAQMTLSDYMLQMALDGKIIVKQGGDFPFELVFELKKIGTNLNQYLKAINTMLKFSPHLPLAPLAEKASKTLDRINEFLGKAMR